MTIPSNRFSVPDGALRLLVVEDDPQIVNMIRRMTEDSHFQVIGSASTSEEIGPAIGKARPDLVLMDIMLNGKPGGLAAAQNIQEHFDLPVVFVSAVADQEILEHARQGGPFGYILKPFKKQELLLAIELAIYRHHTEQQLKQHRDKLEELVRERTNDLTIKNALLEEEVRRGEETVQELLKFRTIAEEANYGISMVDMEGRFIYVNRAYAQMHKCEVGEIIGKPLTTLFPDSGRTQVLQVMHNTIDHGPVNAVRLMRRRKDGSIFPSLVNTILIRDNAGDPLMTCASVTDITEHDRSEEQIRKLSRALEYSASSVIITDTRGRVEYVNPGFTRMTGYSGEEVLGKKANILKARATSRRAYQNLWETLRRREEWRGEFRSQKKSGEFIWESASISPVKNDNGEITHLVAVSEDITQRKLMEEQLRASEEKYRRFVEENLAGVYLTSADGRLLFCNREFVRIFGFDSTEEALQYPVEKFYPKPEDRPVFLEQLKKEKKIEHLESELRRVDGQPVHVIQNITAIFDAAGELQQIQGFLFDVTDLRKLEQQLRQAQKMEAIGTLAGGIAHDFNNILAAILGYAEITVDDLPPGSVPRKNLQAIHRAGLRARDLVRQILTFSRMTEQEIRPIRVDLLLKEALSFLRASLPSNVDLVCDVERTKEAVLGDPSQIHQVVMNLCANAYQALEGRAGRLEVSLKRVQGRKAFGPENDRAQQPALRLRVADNGIGMSKETVSHIFDPFFTTKKVGEGTGLGLSVVHGIVESMNGRIEVDSRPGQGSTFDIYFPCCSEEAPAEPDESDQPATGSERILLVDDDRNFLSMGEQLLARLGYHITPLSDSAKALKLFKDHSHDFDLVISDQIMPGITGGELCQEILQIRPQMPMIMLTGFGNGMTPATAEASGIRKFLNKPVSQFELARAIREVLNETLEQG